MRKDAWVSILFCFCFVGGIAAAQKPSTGSENTLYIRCDTLIDGKSEAPRKDVVIGITEDKTDVVGAAALTSNMRVINLPGHTCLPRPVATHTHVLLQGAITPADSDVQLLWQAMDFPTILATVK